jgi:hypothetical protein
MGEPGGRPGGVPPRPGADGVIAKADIIGDVPEERFGGVPPGEVVDGVVAAVVVGGIPRASRLRNERGGTDEERPGWAQAGCIPVRPAAEANTPRTKALLISVMKHLLK